MTQKCLRSEDPSISRGRSTNDRVLRCAKASTYFFIGTFFATRKSTKSSRGNAHCQLFVTDKSFIHEEQLRKISNLVFALKSFEKEVGVLKAIIADGLPEKKFRR